jgi:hypothetical protein
LSRTVQRYKRRYGYSRDKRSDCVRVVIALIVTPEGFTLAYEVLQGRRRTTRRCARPCKDRDAIRQGATHPGDGSRHPHRAGLERDAASRSTLLLSGWGRLGKLEQALLGLERQARLASNNRLAQTGEAA